MILSATASAGTLSWDNSVVDGVAFTPGVIGVFDYVATTNENGCLGRDTVRVTVAGLPTAGITRDQDTICFGDDILLQGTGGVDYAWSTGDQVSDITVSPVDVTPYQLIVTDANGCTDDTVFFITVVDQPIVDILTNGPLAMCVGDTVTLTATGNGDVVWPDGSTGGTYVADGSITPVYATVTALCGNTAQDSLVIIPGVTPVVDAGPDGTMESDESYQIDAEVSGDTIYVWTPEEGLDCVTCIDPIATPDSTMVYYITATSADGCVAYDSVIVTVTPDSDIWWPNAITGTGEDCCFGFTTELTLEDYYLRIYNRWGELMFESRDQTVFWDGTFRGVHVETGVYVFVMDYTQNGSTETIGGNITVVR